MATFKVRKDLWDKVTIQAARLGRSCQSISSDAVDLFMARLEIEDPGDCFGRIERNRDYRGRTPGMEWIGLNPRFTPETKNWLKKLARLLERTQIAAFEIALEDYFANPPRLRPGTKHFRKFVIPSLSGKVEFSFTDKSLISLPPENPDISRRFIVSGQSLAFALYSPKAYVPRFCQWLLREALSGQPILATTSAVNAAHTQLLGRSPRETEERFSQLMKCVAIPRMHVVDYQQAAVLARGVLRGGSAAEARKMALIGRLIEKGQGIVFTTDEREAKMLSTLGLSYWTPPESEVDFEIPERLNAVK